MEVGFMYLALLFGFDLFFRQLGIGWDQFKAAFEQLWDTGNSDLFLEGVQEVLARFAMGAVGFIVIQIVGLLVGYILISIFARTDIERKNIFKVLLSALVDALILAALIAIIILLLQVAPWVDIIIVILFLPAHSTATLLASYLNHGLKLVGIKRIITLKNVVKLSVCNLVAFIAFILLGMLCALIFNAMIGITLTVALLIVGVCTISLNADSYMNSVIEAAKTNKQLQEAIEAAKSEKYATLAEIKCGKMEEVKIEDKKEEKPEDKKKEEVKA